MLEGSPLCFQPDTRTQISTHLEQFSSVGVPLALTFSILGALVSVLQGNRTIKMCVYTNTHIYRKSDLYKELVHMIMVAGKSQSRVSEQAGNPRELV